MCAGLLTFGLSAQTDAGTFLLDGSTGLGFANQSVTGTNPSDAWDDKDKSSSSNLELNLLGGYFLADGFVAGLAVGYTSTTNVDEDDEGNGDYDNYKSSTSTMIIGPAIKYYVGESGVWAQASYGFGSVKNKSENDWKYGSNSDSSSDEQTNSMSILSFGAGYAIYLSDNVSLNPSIGYSLGSVKTKADQNNGYGYYNSNTGNYEDKTVKTGGLDFKVGIALHLE